MLFVKFPCAVVHNKRHLRERGRKFAPPFRQMLDTEILRWGEPSPASRLRRVALPRAAFFWEGRASARPRCGIGWRNALARLRCGTAISVRQGDGRVAVAAESQTSASPMLRNLRRALARRAYPPMCKSCRRLGGTPRPTGIHSAPWSSKSRCIGFLPFRTVVYQ